HRHDWWDGAAVIVRGPDSVEVGLPCEVVYRALLRGRVRGAPLVATSRRVLAVGVIGPHRAAEMLHRYAEERALVDLGMIVHPPADCVVADYESVGDFPNELRKLEMPCRHHEVQVAVMLTLAEVLGEREHAQSAVLFGHVRAVGVRVHD